MRLLFVLLGAAVSSPINKSRQAVPPGCVDFTITISAWADNTALPVGLTLSNAFLLLNPLVFEVTSQLASGTFDVAATYCPPVDHVEGREETLQVLIHGATYTREYWFGFNYGPQYSWASYASSAGYATLSIDRLGNGQSSHPDPILTVQIPLQVEILHLIIAAARSGNLSLPAPYSGTKFSRIIAVGHSLGSVVVNSLNWRFPADADATILTGFASNLYTLQLLGFLAESGLLDPRYTALPVGYLEFFNKAYFSFLFYNPGEFSTALRDVDFDTRGTISLGEAASLMFGSLQTEYKGPVLVITGQHDSIYCSDVGIDLQFLLGTPTCDMSSAGIVAQAQTLYPLADDFEIVWPNAGHCWQLHDNATYTFGIVHQWLADHGF
ncbi:alpha/beta-hydrolase [Hyaloscypha variabilis F]|uniref:Alpha/beta-hydrolase n=1 Tax=Hyaloscypha variabilis (strain UAMH 11265 / GT02V1 / F) TaxID=1149755 RepID=A0A2J6RNU8_HYAVF|nr:alpha/beta-hydrolase [Hyaloscypha variabilis F]